MDAWTHGRTALVALLLLASARPRVHAAVFQCPDGSPPPCGRPARAAPAAASANSVAVLYFENIGRDTGDTYIAEGLTEEVTARLGQVARLNVTSRTAVRRLRNASEMQTLELGRALNANYLVNGSIRRAGERVRVSVELVRAATGARVWGDQFDRGTADLLAIQEDIARAVATGIAGQLLPAERASIASRPTRSAEAYDHYLRALRHLGTVSPASVGPAIREYEAALAADPTFSAARAGIALAYVFAVNWALVIPGVPEESLLARGAASMERALRENPSSSVAWQARGVLLMYTRPRTFEGAMEALRRSVVIDPEDALGWHWLGVLQRRLGDLDAARATLAHVNALNPTNVQSIADRGFMDLQQRRFREALRWYDSATVVDSLGWQNRTYGARVRLELGDTAGALADARRAVVLSGRQRMAMLALAQVEGRAGNTAAASAIAHAELAQYGPADSVLVRDGYELALALIAAGEADAGLAVLERTRPHGPWLWSYLVFTGFDSVRRDPRFQRIFAESSPPNPPRVPFP